MAGISLSRRAIALIIAVVLAAVATVALVSYVQSAHNDINQPVDAFVAKEPIAAGTTATDIISKGLIEKKTVAQSVLPVGAISSLNEIQGKKAAVDIAQGEVIISPRFIAETGVVPGSPDALNIPTGFQAMSVEVSTIPGVANFVQPGNHVSIILQLAGTSNTNAQLPVVKYLLQDILVLQTGTRVVVPPQNGQPGGSSVQQAAGKVDLTVAVTPVQAEKLALATLQGVLYFTLVPEGQKPANTPGRTARTEFSR